MNTTSQKAYWNKLASEKKFTTSLNLELLQDFVPKPAKIVDFGCGYGRTLNELYNAGYTNIRGFDFSQAMIQRGQNEFPHLDLEIIKDFHTNCPSNSVDMVLLFAVLTCVIEEGEQQKLLREVKRILKPGGLVYINDFLLNTDDRNRERYERFEDKYGTYGVFELPDGGVLRHHDEAYLKTILTDFKQEYFEKTNFITMNGHPANGVVLLARKEEKG